MNESKQESPQLQWLDILQMQADWEHEKPVARVIFKEGHIITQGDPEILAVLERGIPDQDNRRIFPKDGLAFLQAVQAYFHNPPHLFATSIRTGEETPYVPQPWQDLSS